jgi:spore coat protein JC
LSTNKKITAKGFSIPKGIRFHTALGTRYLTESGGPDGELGAALRYLSQRFTIVTPQAIATLNDVGTEELAHLEMIGSICHQLVDKATPQQMREAGMEIEYINHGLGIFPGLGGVPWTAAGIQSKGDPITDLYENMAAEQKARSTYEYLLDLIDDPDVADPIRFLREREVVHMQRFGESLNHVRDYLSSKRVFYAK